MGRDGKLVTLFHGTNQITDTDDLASVDSVAFDLSTLVPQIHTFRLAPGSHFPMEAYPCPILRIF